MRSEEDKIKQLESENARLKIAFAEATLARDAHYQTDVKKKLGPGLSANVRGLKGIK